MSSLDMAMAALFLVPLGVLLTWTHRQLSAPADADDDACGNEAEGAQAPHEGPCPEGPADEARGSSGTA